MAEHKFVPKPGQIDYTNIRYAPCIKVIPVHDGKILVAKRTTERRLYPGYWDFINGFLDDKCSIEEKATEELAEEVGIGSGDVASFKRGKAAISEDPDYGKTWLIVPVLAEVKTAKFDLDWEATEAKWLTPSEAASIEMIPGTLEIVSQFFPEMLK